MVLSEQILGDIQKSSDEKVRVKIVTSDNGKQSLDIRIYWDANEDGVYIATKKGVRVDLEELEGLITILEKGVTL